MLAQFEVLSEGASEPFVCECGARCWPGEIVHAVPKSENGRIGVFFLECLECARAKGDVVVPIELVAKSARLTRDHFCHALAEALVGREQPAKVSRPRTPHSRTMGASAWALAPDPDRGSFVVYHLPLGPSSEEIDRAALVVCRFGDRLEVVKARRAPLGPISGENIPNQALRGGILAALSVGAEA